MESHSDGRCNGSSLMVGKCQQEIQVDSPDIIVDVQETDIVWHSIVMLKHDANDFKELQKLVADGKLFLVSSYELSI